MTSFNAGSYLSEAVKSLLSQTFRHWKLILIDNGSTDDSFSTLHYDDPRIRKIVITRNIGRTPALQLALSYVDTPFTAVLDADDIALPNRFAKQVEFLEHSPTTVLVGSRVIVIGERHTKKQSDFNIVGKISHDQLAERNVFVHSSVMFRTNYAHEVGGYDSTYTYAQDYALFIKLAARANCHILDEELTILRYHTKSTTTSRSSVLPRLNDEWNLVNLAATELNLSRLGKRFNRRRKALIQIEFAFHNFLRGRIRSGVYNLILSIRLDPTLSFLSYLVSGRRAPNLRQEAELPGPVDESHSSS